MDLALDPFPYNGTTTTAEALWMGVPVLTLRGNSFISHVGESMLHNAGLTEWIAQDQEDYLTKAVSSPQNLQHLATLRSTMRQRLQSSPLFDAPRFTQHFQQALLNMWQRFLSSNNGRTGDTPHVSPHSTVQAQP